MAHKGKLSMLSLFQPVPLSTLTFLSPIDQLKDILLSEPLKPENLSDSTVDPNTCLIAKLQDYKKKANPHKDLSHRKDSNKHQQKKNEVEHKQKVYRKGPFAEFYQQNQEVFDKDAEAWYYKEGKQIIGPVSSYNMDKMVYHKTVTGETRVAFKSVDKFVKFSKIQKVLEDAKAEREEQEDTHHTEKSEQVSKQESQKEQAKEVPKVQAVAESPKTQPKPEPKPKIIINIDDHNEFPPL